MSTATTKAKARTKAKDATREPDDPGRYRRAAEACKGLSDPTRLLVLLRLDEGPCNVTELIGVVGLMQPAVSHHLSLLRVARLIEPTRRGKFVDYSLTDAGRELVRAVSVLVK